jgi:hypothetical protein
MFVDLEVTFQSFNTDTHCVLSALGYKYWKCTYLMSDTHLPDSVNQHIKSGSTHAKQPMDVYETLALDRRRICASVSTLCKDFNAWYWGHELPKMFM